MKQLPLKQLILNEIEKQPRGYSEDLAVVSGYSSGSALKKVLNDQKKEFDKFSGLINLVRHIWGNETIQILVSFSEEIDPNKKTARNMLEFLASSRQFDALNNLLDKMDDCSNKESKEWAKIYRMESKYQFIKEPEEAYKLIQDINAIHITFSELEVYKKILIHYCCYLKKDYNTMKFLLEQIQEDVELIKNEYIKERYLIKVYEITAYTNLYVFDDKEGAKECADWILNSSATPSYKAYANFIKGVSYTFSSYDEAIKYLNKSIELYETIDRWNDIKEVEQEIQFIKIYWDKKSDCESTKNKLFMKVKNNYQLSEEELNNTDLDQEFKFFLEGYSNKDNKKLLLSLIKFIKKNNLFLANMPRIELLKNGYDSEIISEMISINIA